MNILYIRALQNIGFGTYLLLLALFAENIWFVGAFLVLAIVTNPNIFCNFVLGNNSV